MAWLYYVILLLMMALGVFLTLVTLPGLWLMVAAAAGYALVTHRNHIGLKTLAVMLAIAVVAEILETMAAGRATRMSGGSRRAALGALVGGVLGAIFLTIPLMLIGTLIGACIGAFVGAAVMEITKHGQTGKSLNVGVAAATGKFAGAVLKLLLAIVLLLIAAWQGLPV